MRNKVTTSGPPKALCTFMRRDFLKEIKTKPARGKNHVLDKAETVPKTAMKEMWLHAKEKTLRETMNSPFYSEQEATGNAPANTAGDQMLSGAETAAKRGTETAYESGRKLAQFAGRKIKERREIARMKQQGFYTQRISHVKPQLV